MSLPRDSSPSSGAEPTLAVTPPGATPDARLIDPNAPTAVPLAPGDPTRPLARAPRIDEAPPPATIGRFTVIRELGRGGTGVVYAAYDEQLDRKVAVKLLHSETREDLARARLMREAQAMARLSHPNIVGVHEVGTFGRQVYVAMEFVHGMTLHAWLKRQRRELHEIVAVFLQAGEGLAAAHDAGLVHRDFKPANAMVGDDGRVRVLDFGLARAEVEAGAAPGMGDLRPAPEHASSVANLRSLDASITVTGVMLGTPAYMAPEQFLGVRVDARSDQFGFCVSLFEATMRARPFVGDTLAELMTNVLSGAVRDVPAPASLPRGLRPLLLRGLSRAPEERWPDMRALLAALAPFARAPAKRSRLAALGVAAALLGGGASLAYETGAMGQACTGGAERVAAVWGEGARERVADAARGAGLEPAVAAAARASAAFDAYGAAWSQAHAAACAEAGALLDLRMTCLDERRQALAAAVGMFERIDAEVVAHADEMLASLPRIEACADEEYLRARVRPPDDPAVRARVDALRAELQDAVSRETGEKFAEALEILDAALAAAPEAYPPLRAELQFRRGSVLENAGRYEEASAAFEDAFLVAVASDYLEFVTDAATRLAYIAGRRLNDSYAAGDWLDHAEVYAKRHGDPLRHGRVLIVRGALANHWSMNLAVKQEDRGALFAEAERLLREAGAEDTVDYARYLRFYGDYLSFGRDDQPAAAAAQERALALMRKSLGEGHPDVAMIYNSLGIAQLRAERPDQARATFQAALDAAVDLPNQRNHVYMTIWFNLAEVLGKDEPDRAEDAMREAIGVLERSSARFIPETFFAHLTLARMLGGHGKRDAALAEFAATLARAEAAWGPVPRLSDLLVARADLYFKLGDRALARADAERAVAVTRGEKETSTMRLGAEWVLARSLAADGEGRRALEIVRPLRAQLGAAEQRGNREWIAEIDAFIAELEAPAGPKRPKATRKGDAP